MEAIAIPQALLDSPFMAVKSRGKNLIQEGRACNRTARLGGRAWERHHFMEAIHLSHAMEEVAGLSVNNRGSRDRQGSRPNPSI